MTGRGFRLILTILVDAIIIIAVVLALRLLVVFSDRIHAQSWAQAIDALTAHLVIPFRMRQIQTPYGGYFDVNAALTVVLAILAEVGLSAARDRT
jgi:uncharacterized protein YggT (Ycf19 family)